MWQVKYKYRKSSFFGGGEGVLFIPSPFERDLIETGWGLGALNYLQLPMVSVHHKELEYNVEELK